MNSVGDVSLVVATIGAGLAAFTSIFALLNERRRRGIVASAAPPVDLAADVRAVHSAQMRRLAILLSKQASDPSNAQVLASQLIDRLEVSFPERDEARLTIHLEDSHPADDLDRIESALIAVLTDDRAERRSRPPTRPDSRKRSI